MINNLVTFQLPIIHLKKHFIADLLLRRNISFPLIVSAT